MNTTTTPRPEGQAELNVTDADRRCYVAVQNYIAWMNEEPGAKCPKENLSGSEIIAAHRQRSLATPQAAAAGEAPDWPEAAAKEIIYQYDLQGCLNPERIIAATIRAHSLAGQPGKGAELLMEIRRATVSINRDMDRSDDGQRMSCTHEEWCNFANRMDELTKDAK